MDSERDRWLPTAQVDAKKPCERAPKCKLNRIAGERFCARCRMEFKKQMQRDGYLTPAMQIIREMEREKLRGWYNRGRKSA